MRHAVPGPGWTVLVTGASSGLGQALALELADRGCALVLAGRDAGRLAVAAEAAVARGAPNATPILGDLDTPEGTSLFLEKLLSLDTPVDALVNNAGAGVSGPWRDLEGAREARLLQLLVQTPLTLTRALMPGWKAQNRGAVLNIASSGAFQPGPQTAVYYAAKAFLSSWSQALAQEERPWLRVTTAYPGALRTPFAETAGRQPSPGASDPVRVAASVVNAWGKGQRVVVPGMANKALVAFSRFLPLPWSAAVVDRIQGALRNR